MELREFGPPCRSNCERMGSLFSWTTNRVTDKWHHDCGLKKGYWGAHAPPGGPSLVNVSHNRGAGLTDIFTHQFRPAATQIYRTDHDSGIGGTLPPLFRNDHSYHGGHARQFLDETRATDYGRLSRWSCNAGQPIFYREVRSDV
jgi:hypothetical protein